MVAPSTRLVSRDSLRVAALAVVVVLVTVVAAAAQSPDRRLVAAVKAHDLTTVRALLEARADVNVPDVEGMTPLHWAVHHDDLALATQLIGAGAAADASNRYGVRPMAIACLNGSAAIVDALIRAGADANGAMPEGETPLMTAARVGSAETVALLLARGADPNAKDEWRGQTALMWAAAEGHAAVVRALVARGADLGARAAPPARNVPRARATETPTSAQRGMTAAAFAVRGGHLETTLSLLDAGADVNDRTPTGASLLHLAILNAHFEVAARLVERGADVHAVIGAGVTPLHQLVQVRRPLYATRPAPVPTGTMDSLALMKVLLSHGARVDAGLQPPKVRIPAGEDAVPPPGGGATPFWLAARGPDVDAMRVLLQAGADPKVKTDDGVTVLMAAAGIGFRQGTRPKLEPEVLEAVKLALDHGGDVHATDVDGFTALHGAAFRGVNSVAALLLERGARLDARSKAGQTPLDVANDASDARAQPETAAFFRKVMASRAARQ